jgi:hypothetical protein
MKNQFRNTIEIKKNMQIPKKVAPIQTAFTTDVGHIESLGNCTDSPFAKPQIKPREPIKDYPSLMSMNGFTRSERPLFEKEGNSTGPGQHHHQISPGETINWKSLLKQQYNEAQKQKTGSIKNNKPFFALPESPESRFTTETKERYI